MGDKRIEEMRLELAALNKEAEEKKQLWFAESFKWDGYKKELAKCATLQMDVREYRKMCCRARLLEHKMGVAFEEWNILVCDVMILDLKLQTEVFLASKNIEF
jgi:hypothetical protein